MFLVKLSKPVPVGFPPPRENLQSALFHHHFCVISYQDEWHQDNFQTWLFVLLDLSDCCFLSHLQCQSLDLTLGLLQLGIVILYLSFRLHINFLDRVKMELFQKFFPYQHLILQIRPISPISHNLISQFTPSKKPFPGPPTLNLNRVFNNNYYL